MRGGAALDHPTPTVPNHAQPPCLTPPPTCQNPLFPDAWDVPLLSTSAALVGLLSCYLAARLKLDASMRLFVITFVLGESPGWLDSCGSPGYLQKCGDPSSPHGLPSHRRPRPRPPPSLPPRASAPGAVTFGTQDGRNPEELALLRTSGILLGVFLFSALAVVVLPKSATIEVLR